MPRLLKKIEANIISLFGGGGSDFTAIAYLVPNKVPKVIGEVGTEDYIKLTNYEALTQDFSSVIGGGFCSETTITYGLGACSNYEDLNIDY